VGGGTADILSGDPDPMSSVPSPASGGTADILPQERATCSFDIGALRQAITGREPANREQASDFSSLFGGAPFDSIDEDAFRGYVDLYKVKHERAAAAMKLVHANPKFKAAHQSGHVQMSQFLDSCGMVIHFTLFLTFLRTQASKEQQQAWLEKAVNGRFLGAYAQTELGHGSNIRALETTATFDHATDEFVVHSPTLTSMKWWPTGIYACTHGVVMAQLIIDGVNSGFHGFFMQLRDDEGRCMPGVEVGEIGPKFDQQHNYIGYARFNQVRIPRFNLFAKNQQVTRDGKYIAAPPRLSKFKYISMMSTRVAFVMMSGHSLGQAATIAIRYSCVRRQGFKDTQAAGPLALGENVVMDYKVQQYRTFKALGLACMFVMNGRWLYEYLGRVQKAVSDGDASAADELPDLHSSCAGLKVWSTIYAHEGMEDMRKACGGQGFLRSSGLADIVTNFGVAVTGEGEQVILNMQTARFVIKAVREVKDGKVAARTVKYLEEAPAELLSLRDCEGKPESLLDFFKDRARRFALGLEERFARLLAQGKTFDQALNDVHVLAYKTADVHCAYVLSCNFHEAIDKYVKDPAAKTAVQRLEELALLVLLREQGADWVETLSYDQLDFALERIQALCDSIRPDCVGLTDALGHSDKALKSTLGRYDGNVYEAIYEEAKKNPLNTEGAVAVGWEHFREVLDLDFLREGMRTQRTTAEAMTAGAVAATRTARL
jgi:acyl-CoA oxidase